jgi:hypothetical protein
MLTSVIMCCGMTVKRMGNRSKCEEDEGSDTDW